MSNENYIVVKNLSFGYENKKIFHNLDLHFEKGKKYIVVGLNGCGKSTLLKLIGGKTLCEYDSIRVLNKDPFRDTTLNNNIAFLDNNWGMTSVAFAGYSLPLQSGLKVNDMMVKLKETYPERNKELIDVLNINTEWKLNCISEGQRKRVQLYLNLIKPFDICLLDEITVNLDIVIKDRFMNYLKKESEKNNCCIIYVTHIFDGLDNWCDNLLYLKQNGTIGYFDKKPNKPLYEYLLALISSEKINKYEDEVYKNRNKIEKNAGGYTSGTLINHILT
tara:strand:- start:33248 stop:34075 length:828 start_codon:yes stop_codon:yes gene_type:complete